MSNLIGSVLRFLVMLSQQAQDFGRSVPDPFTSSRRRGLGTRLVTGEIIPISPPVLNCHTHTHISHKPLLCGLRYNSEWLVEA